MEKFINSIFTAMSDGLKQALSLLPLSPFTFERVEGLSEIMGYVNYFIPIDKMLSVTVAWCGSIALWYGIQIVLRWVKAIE